jgi:cation transport regulator ChaB
VDMPRRGRDDTEIPSTIERSDKHAQEIWKKTHDSAVETYGEGRRAHQVAFASLKHSYQKTGDHWERKSRKGPSDEQAARGPTTRTKSTSSHPAPTAGGRVETSGKSREDLYEEAKRLQAPGRSSMNKQELAMAVREAKVSHRN